MQTSYTYYFQTFRVLKSLFWRDILVYQNHVFKRMFDAIFWSSCVIFVNQYMMPALGVTSKFGIFNLVGNILVWGLFELNTQIAELITDDAISYYFTLPITPTWYLVKQGFTNAYKSWASSIAIIIPGVILINTSFDWSSINYPLFFLMHGLSMICFGFFSLFLASLAKDLSFLTTIRSRVLFPLWFLGCTLFSWHVLFKNFPSLAYLNLCNPVTYIMEGTRIAVFGQSNLLPFWLCFYMIIIFTLLFGYIGIARLKKRFDCI